MTRPAAPSSEAPTIPALFGSGLRAGLLTFGGAYTAIPFVKRDAVEKGGWMSEPEFLDGLALSGILPAPLIIFSTFVGFVGGGLGGALAMTLGIFLPAFLFPLILHRHLEGLLHHSTLRHLLEGVTAGVVGIIFVTTIRLGIEALTTAPSVVIAAVTLTILYAWNSKAAIPLAILAAGIAGAWMGS
jgi:chromate transporter